jgi:(5-formylfuran-3-yl)methyl phosphate synthase
VASLLVSVRSADEALAALEGGADLIDVKEPDRGPLGRADVSVWTEVRNAVPSGTPVSVALGELREWQEGLLSTEHPGPGCFRGFSFRKLGLSGAGADWARAWAQLRRRFGAGPSWVAVVYADWERADAPRPEVILDAALATEACAGVLFDTWDKSHETPIELSWAPWFERVRDAGRLTALAGRLDPETIKRLAPLRPDVVAVRGAACQGGDRLADVDPYRVAELVRAVALI